jgi:hypothetical protein
VSACPKKPVLELFGIIKNVVCKRKFFTEVENKWKNLRAASKAVEI